MQRPPDAGHNLVHQRGRRFGVTRPPTDAVTDTTTRDPLLAFLAALPLWEPMALVTVRAHIAPYASVILDSPINGRPTYSHDGTSELFDLVLEMASVGINSVLKSDASPEHPTFGPLSQADIFGAGAVRCYSFDGRVWMVPLLPTPALGSWGRGIPSQTVSAAGRLQVDSVSTLLANRTSRRLTKWTDRYKLRLARGEWDEAVVSLEASVEQGLSFTLDAILVDHGWSGAQIRAARRDLLKTLGVIQHHLGGSGATWATVRSDLKMLFELRNDVVHRGHESGRKRATDAGDRLESFLTVVRERLKESSVAHKHPLTAYLWDSNTTSLGADLREVCEQTFSDSSTVEWEDLNEAVAVDPPTTTNAAQCGPAVSLEYARARSAAVKVKTPVPRDPGYDYSSVSWRRK